MRRKIERVNDAKTAASQPTEKKREQRERAKPPVAIKLFGRWDSDVEIKDPGLKTIISLEPRMIPRSAGRLRRTFHKSRAHITERLAQHLMVPGHMGRKHKLTSGTMGGSYYNAIKAVEGALEIIEQQEKKNPIEIFVRAIENCALREEIITYQMGSIVAREGVISAPQRRVDKTLRLFAQGAYRRSFGKKTTLAKAIADEIIAAYHGKESFALKERERIEREAAGAR